MTIIFSSDLENATHTFAANGWTGSGANASLSTTKPHSGAYSAYYNGSGGVRHTKL